MSYILTQIKRTKNPIYLFANSTPTTNTGNRELKEKLIMQRPPEHATRVHNLLNKGRLHVLNHTENIYAYRKGYENY